MELEEGNPGTGREGYGEESRRKKENTEIS